MTTFLNSLVQELNICMCVSVCVLTSVFIAMYTTKVKCANGLVHAGVVYLML